MNEKSKRIPFHTTYEHVSDSSMRYYFDITSKVSAPGLSTLNSDSSHPCCYLGFLVRFDASSTNHNAITALCVIHKIFYLDQEYYV